MASSPKESRKVLEGIFAINKPQWASSAGVLRDLQTHFDKSSLFTPWLTQTKRAMQLSNSRPRAINNLKVKLGHGGTLDPLATGVLIVGVGKGTKCLQRFLECTKSYECVVLFGAATDTYDSTGKVVARAEYKHVTRELVEEKLGLFRGKIMQKPSVFSALKVDGKKMYEYARAGGDVPEVPARPVEVESLELVEWLEPGEHEYMWPKEEVDGTAKVGAEKLMGIRKEDAEAAASRGRKRSRSPKDETVTDVGSQSKKPKTDDETTQSDALPAEVAPSEIEAEQAPVTETQNDPAPDTNAVEPSSGDGQPLPQPPAARLRMTVTSGFYVRSLCHDLGLALSSLGLMSSLIRSRQGTYSLNANVLEYSDLEAGPDVWEPKVQGYLKEFMEKEGWEGEEVESEEEWQKKWKERKEERRDGGGGNRGARWKGKGRGKRD
ncbi:pseudouridine synthase pus4 [Kalmusia sp. IMI 367209]|nr:pseudouridine synthase pus4 [Kalmusia sp. IMI 367209]